MYGCSCKAKWCADTCLLACSESRLPVALWQAYTIFAELNRRHMPQQTAVGARHLASYTL